VIVIGMGLFGRSLRVGTTFSLDTMIPSVPPERHYLLVVLGCFWRL